MIPYAERVSASDNLRYALDGGASDQPAWGASKEEPKPIETASTE